ncbi:hypothetical protein DSO57_1002371 [Entomophthora muscae]|uniref:Uncharacterized protein n=1 Tax=Entomophthora muscae TaxID=34485 RepID=A0ACC2RNP2_9FUNG|nr:hypothetical protein DSO57_1002371 [Entomophthora muscae]
MLPAMPLLFLSRLVVEALANDNLKDPNLSTRTVSILRNIFRKRKKTPPITLVQEINEFMSFAAYSYCNARVTLSDKHVYSIKHIWNSTTDAYAHVYREERRRAIIISFRGADTYSKLLLAASTVQIESFTDGAKVSSYSYSLMETLKEEVIETIHQNQHHQPIFKVVLVGHSLGRSIATLMAPFVADVSGISPPSLRILTYNQPRVGNKAFAKYFNQLHFNFTRVVNKNDPIPQYPTYSAGWSHVHQEVYIDKNDNYMLCSTRSPEDPGCSLGKSSWLSFQPHHSYIGNTRIFNKYSSYCS